jgi:hypothetical protein
MEGRSMNDSTIKSIIDSPMENSILIRRDGMYYLSDPLIAGVIRSSLSCT